jgi:dTMP kinase
LNKGIFITIEGIDGCGKSTQTELLANYLKKYFDVIQTREPGGIITQNKNNFQYNVRELILSKKFNISSLTELFLLEASRAEHFEKVIIPSLKKGKIVVCDRCCDSTLAYQGYARGLNINMIKSLNKFSTQDIKPNLTIFFDIDPKTSYERIKIRNKKSFDRMEKEGLFFQKKVSSGYKKIAMQNKQRIRTIKIKNESIQEIHEQTVVIIKNFLNKIGVKIK